MSGASHGRFIPRNLSCDENYHEKRVTSLLVRRTLCAARSKSVLKTDSGVVRNVGNACTGNACDDININESGSASTDLNMTARQINSNSEIFQIDVGESHFGDTDATESDSRTRRTYSTDSDNFSEDYTDVREFDNSNESDCFAKKRSIEEKLGDLRISTFEDEDAESDAGSSESGITLKADDELEDARESDATEANPGLKLLMLTVDKDMSEHGSLYEDREFDFLKSEPVRRTVSLKSNKTPPGSPHRKKEVRFADVLGLDLESVRHILNRDVPPKIPASATADLAVGIEEDRRTEGSRYLTACFPQPGAAPNFLTRVVEQKVALENCVVDDQELTITGTVRVANIAFHKAVKVRYTTNNWLTFTDVIANYMANSCDGTTDRFNFSIVVPQYFGVGSKLQLAVSYTVNGEVFWDNNHGSNYVIQCYARSFPTVETDKTWVHFL